MSAHPPNAETTVFVELVDQNLAASYEMLTWATWWQQLDSELNDEQFGGILVRVGLSYLGEHPGLRNRSHLIDRAYVGARWREAVTA